MIDLNIYKDQQKRGWMSAGVLLLLGFLINLPFAGQSIASTVDLSAARSSELLQQRAVNTSLPANGEPCLHHKRSNIKAVIDHGAHALHGSSLHLGHGIHICCDKGDIAKRTVLQRDRSRIAKPVFLASTQVDFGLVEEGQLGRFAPAFDHSRVEIPQIVGLSGAQYEFLQTQRLLT